MCDYSLHSVRSRPAKIGDKLMTKNFGTGTRGFAPVTDASTAVCVLPRWIKNESDAWLYERKKELARVISH
jgi:hypothetical protein